MIRALSLYQPHASLYVSGIKGVETRSKPIKPGLLAIAATAKTPKEWAESMLNAPLVQEAIEAMRQSAIYRAHREDPLPNGAVLGIVRVTRCVRCEEIRFSISPRERALGNYSPSRFAIFAEPVEWFETPVPCKGGQFLWRWDDGKPEHGEATLFDQGGVL